MLIVVIKMENIQKQMGKVSRKMETKKKSKETARNNKKRKH